MGSVSRVVGNQAAPAEKNGDMGATVGLPRTLQLELAYQVATDGKATVRFTGELDIATADQAYAYLRDVVDGFEGGFLQHFIGELDVECILECKHDVDRRMRRQAEVVEVGLIVHLAWIDRHTAMSS